MSTDFAREKAYALVAAALPTTSIKFENQKFVQPSGAPWVKISVQPTHSSRKDIGANRRIFRHLGVINCVVLVPEDTGMKTLTNMTDAIFKALADQKFAIPGGGYISFCYAKRSNAGVMNGWQSARVAVEYHIDIVE
jgi:Bacteriophage related domain of unknown function